MIFASPKAANAAKEISPNLEGSAKTYAFFACLTAFVFRRASSGSGVVKPASMYAVHPEEAFVKTVLADRR